MESNIVMDKLLQLQELFVLLEHSGASPHQKSTSLNFPDIFQAASSKGKSTSSSHPVSLQMVP